MATKQANWPFVINLGNSIIGVSVLAMPFCFKQCGVLLGMLLLCSSAFLTKMSCSLLIRGAHTSRKRSYEYLALHTFGPAGKLCVEISIIGLLVGTCVAFFVVIGDLGPAIISRIFGIENTSNLRAFLMVFLATFVALPLGLLKNIESLSNISAMSIGFYTVFVAEVFVTSFPNLWSGIWVAEVVYWNPAGVFKCLPIFSLAFSCQTQLFVMYDALAEPSLKRISNITKSAIGMCTSVYLLVGFFGYVAFCREEINGDIMLNFRPTIFSEAVKLGFVLSIAVSFPLVIFPLRAALFTLLFHKEHEKQDIMGPIYMPDLYLKGLTFCIIVVTLIVGILLPNIEFVLALTGATMGSMICFIFPAVMFISVMSNTNSHGKSTAQVVLFLGVTILLASTYVTLNSQDQDKLTYEEKVAQPLQDDLPGFVVDKSVREVEVKDEAGAINPKEEIEKHGDDVIKEKEQEVEKQELEEGEKRQEPPNPQAPVDKEKDEEAKLQKAELDAVEQKVAEDLEKLQQQEDSKKAEGKKDEKRTEDKADTKDSKAEKVAAGESQGEAKHLLNELKEQQKVQEQLIEEQKQIIQELKQHQKEAHQADEEDLLAKQQQAQQQGQPQGQPAQQQGQLGQQGQPVHGDQLAQGGQPVQQLPGQQLLQDQQQLQGQQLLQGQQVLQGQQQSQQGQQLLQGQQQPQQGQYMLQGQQLSQGQVGLESMKQERQQGHADNQQRLYNQQGQQIANQLGQPLANHQGQPIVNQQGQPMANQQGQPMANQQEQLLGNQKGLPIVNQQGQPIAQQQGQLVNPQGQPLANQQGLPVVGNQLGQAIPNQQAVLNQQDGNQGLQQNQPMPKQPQQPIANQQLVDKQQLGNQQQPLVNQQLGNQQQQLGNQQLLANQQPLGNQLPIDNQKLQPLGNQQILEESEKRGLPALNQDVNVNRFERGVLEEAVKREK